jgi:oligopeptide/dipeptide ABC transporter ATP-binding protein
VVPDLRDLGAACAFAPRCTLAEPRCSNDFPPLVPVGPQHEAECWRTDMTRERP